MKNLRNSAPTPFFHRVSKLMRWLCGKLGLSFPAASHGGQLRPEGFGSMRRILTACALTFSVAACNRTVSWEEEVLLNTTQLVTLKRSAEFRYETSHDRLFKPYWQFKAERLEFQLQGKSYSYRSEPNNSELTTIAPLVLAIDPTGAPNFIGYVDSYWVHQKAQGCGPTSIVRLVPVSGAWRSAAASEAWITGLQINLRSAIDPPLGGTRLSWSEKVAEFSSWPPASRTLDLTFVADTCKGRK